MIWKLKKQIYWGIFKLLANKHDKEIFRKFQQNFHMLHGNSHNSVKNNAMDLGQSLKDTY